MEIVSASTSSGIMVVSGMFLFGWVVVPRVVQGVREDEEKKLFSKKKKFSWEISPRELGLDKKK